MLARGLRAPNSTSNVDSDRRRRFYCAKVTRAFAKIACNIMQTNAHTVRECTNAPSTQRRSTCQVMAVLLRCEPMNIHTHTIEARSSRRRRRRRKNSHKRSANKHTKFSRRKTIDNIASSLRRQKWRVYIT